MTLRSDTADFLTEWYGELLTAAGVTAADAQGGLKLPLDQADALTAGLTDDGMRYRLLAERYTLLRVINALSTQFNVSLGGDSFSLNQQVAEARKSLTLVESALIAHYGTVDGPFDGSGSGGTLDFDLVQPPTTTDRDLLPADWPYWLGPL